MQPLDRRSQADRALHHFAQLVLEQLRVQQLLAVFPLVQGLGFVQAFVTLHSDQGHVEDLGHALGQFGLSDTGRAFDQDRLFQVESQIDRGRDFAAGNVVDRSQALRQAVDGIKVVLVKCFHGFPWGAAFFRRLEVVGSRRCCGQCPAPGAGRAPG